MKSFALIALASCAVLVGCASNSGTPPTNGTPSTSPATRNEICKYPNNEEVASWFDRWNRSLQTGNAEAVVANYAEPSLLLPTASDKARWTPEEKEKYFRDIFLPLRPTGVIDLPRFIEIGCNRAVDAGFYTFTYQATGKVVKARYTFTYRWDGSKWLITTHHSSVVPPATPTEE